MVGQSTTESKPTLMNHMNQHHSSRRRHGYKSSSVSSSSDGSSSVLKFKFNREKGAHMPWAVAFDNGNKRVKKRTFAQLSCLKCHDSIKCSKCRTKRTSQKQDHITRSFDKQQAIDTAVQVFVSAITVDPGIKSFRSSTHHG